MYNIYIKIENGILGDIIPRPKWFTDDGEPVSDEYLISEGIYPLFENYPEYNHTTQIITQNDKTDWIIEEDKVLKTYTIKDLSIEEQRARYPRLSMVDFRKKLRSLKVIKREDEEELDGIYEEDILEKISLIADKELQAEARDYFLYAQYIERTNPWIDILGAMFEISPEDIDKFWLA